MSNPTTENTPEHLTNADHKREAYQIASESIRMTAETLEGIEEGEWTGERKDGVLLYLEDIAQMLGSRANTCGRF